MIDSERCPTCGSDWPYHYIHPIDDKPGCVFDGEHDAYHDTPASEAPVCPECEKPIYISTAHFPYCCYICSQARIGRREAR